MFLSSLSGIAYDARWLHLYLWLLLQIPRIQCRRLSRDSEKVTIVTNIIFIETFACQQLAPLERYGKTTGGWTLRNNECVPTWGLIKYAEVSLTRVNERRLFRHESLRRFCTICTTAVWHGYQDIPENSVIKSAPRLSSSYSAPRQVHDQPRTRFMLPLIDTRGICGWITTH